MADRGRQGNPKLRDFGTLIKDPKSLYAEALHTELKKRSEKIRKVWNDQVDRE